MTVLVRAWQGQGWGRVLGRLGLLIALCLAPLTHGLTHGPGAVAEAAVAQAQDLAHDLAHGHAHDAPAGHHDSTDHDHPTVALIPPQPAPALMRLPDLAGHAAQLWDGRERGHLLRPPRALT